MFAYARVRCVGGYTFDAVTDLLDLVSICRILRRPVLAGADPNGMARRVKQAIAITDNGTPLKTKIRRASLMFLKIKPHKMKTRVQPTTKDEGTWMQKTLRHMP